MPISYPVRMQIRQVTKGRGGMEARVLDRDGKHVISMQSVRSEKYEEHVQHIVDALNQGTMKTKSEAQAFLQEKLLGELPRLA